MRRSDTFTFKCSAEERRMIDALARKLERSQSDTVRVVLRKAALEAGAWVVRSETEHACGRSAARPGLPTEGR